MARAIMLALICASTIATTTADGRVGAVAMANPIRRVVTLLQGLAKKIKEEGEKEEKLHEEYMCYCKRSKAEIAQSISINEAKLPQLRSGLEESQSKVKQLKMELKSAAEDQSAAKAALSSANEERGKENKEYVAESSEYKSYLDTLKSAIPAIQKGMSSSFLQAHGMQATLQTALESSMVLGEYEKRDVMAFLSGSTDLDGPKSEEIAGMLNTMKEEADKNLAEVESAEAEQVKTHEELVAAKTKQIHNLREPTKEKEVRIGELALTIANIKKDLAETSAALSSDQEFATDLAKSCSEKAAAVEKNAAARSEELVAVSDTIKILNDDDALDVFKKTLPGASLLQVDTSAKNQRLQALGIVRRFRSTSKSSNWGKSDLDLLELTLKGGKADFSKVTKMIDGMVKLAKEEQATDDKKLAQCKKDIAASESQMKDFAQKLNYLAVTADEWKDQLSSVAEEIKTITASIKQLDADVEEATAQRKSEHSEFVALTSGNHAAIDLLNKAKSRMNQFYNPSKHPKTGFIVLPAWNGASSASFVQTSSHIQLAHKKESNKVISMLTTLIEDLAKEVQVAELEEGYSQKDYERVMTDSEKRRADSANALVENESVKADAEDALLEVKRSLESEAAQKADAEKYASEVRSECTWLMDNYDARKAARETEAAALHDTKVTLAGGDVSLIQIGSLRGARAASL